MTYIQPNKKSIISRLLIAFLVVMVLTGFWLVILYNKTVDIEHEIITMRKNLKNTEAKNIELREKIFALFDSSNLENILGESLIKDKNPEYLEIKSGGITQASVLR